jgi:hypothetical protein
VSPIRAAGVSLPALRLYPSASNSPIIRSISRGLPAITPVRARRDERGAWRGRQKSRYLTENHINEQLSARWSRRLSMVGIIKFFGVLSIIVGVFLILVSFGTIIFLPVLLSLGANALLSGALLIAFARVVELLESIDDKIMPVRATTSVQSLISSGPSRVPVQGTGFDEEKWHALVEFDPDVAAAAKKLRPLGRKYVDELARTFLALNDKKYLDAIVRRIVERYEAMPESERFDDLDESVAYIYATPWGYIAAMTDETVIVLRGAEVDVLSSIKAYYDKYEEDSSSWRELTDPNEKRDFYKRAADVLRKLADQ